MRLIWGTEDDEITPAMVDVIRDLVPLVDFRPVEGADHGVVPQRPHEVTDLILEFLR